MISCPLCPKEFPAKALLTHINCDHGKLDGKRTYKCKAKGCSRLYDKLKSFLSHIESCPYVKGGTSSCTGETGHNLNSALDADLNSALDAESGESSTIHSTTSFNFQDYVKSNSDEFVATLHSLPKLPRNYVQKIVDKTSQIISECVATHLKEQVLKTLQVCAATKEQVSDIENMFNVVSNSFSHLSTEHRRFKYFSTCGYFIPPESHVIGEKLITDHTVSGSVRKPKVFTVQSIPLNSVLKNFLELPGCFPSIMAYLESLDTEDPDILENFVQCSSWKEKRAKYSDSEIVFPLFVYFDEVQSNNPLGSHSKLLGSVYVSLPCLPPECQSAVENIFLALLFENVCRQHFDDKVVFAPLIDQLTALEKKGIVISTPNGPQKIRFVCGALLGDNKGLNSVSGFVECFTANYWCRFCKSHRLVTQSQTVENLKTLRTEVNYINDLKLNDSSLTGVKYSSAFNKLPSFNVISNFVVDGFHDLQEGICHYVLLHVLDTCIPKYFSLDLLNSSIESFDYGLSESNKIPAIQSLDRDKLKMSGSETLLFTKMLGILIGNYVPETEPMWLLYLKLLEILDIVLAKRIPRNLCKSLKIIAMEFNDMYVKITGDTLKPKMHNLVHYAKVIENCGPIELLSTLRFESKHRSLTVPANATSSRIDICKSAAISHQLNLSFRFQSKLPFMPSLEVGPVDLVYLSDFEDYNLFWNCLPPSFKNESNEVLTAHWVNRNGTVYKPGMVLLLNVNEYGLEVFGKLSVIIVEGDSVYFLCTYFINLGFNSHLHAWCGELTNTWCCKEPNQLFDPLPLSVHSHCQSGLNAKYIVTRYILS